MLVPKQVFAVGKVAATEQGRYAINGVQLERTPDGRPLAVATDGKRMIAAVWHEDPKHGDDWPAEAQVPGQDIGTDGAIVPLELWKQIAKGIPAKTMRPGLKQAQVKLEGRQVNAVTSNLLEHRKTGGLVVEGVFPKFRQVIPKGEKKAYITFNAKYLAEVALAVAEAAGPRPDGKEQTVTLAIEDESRAALIVAGTPGASVLGVLMPCWDKEAKAGEDGKYVDRIVAEITGGEVAKALAEKAKRKAKVEAECCAEDEQVPCAECGPVAHVNEVVAEAFGMKGMPNVEVHETRSAGFGAEPDEADETQDVPAMSPEEADLLRQIQEQKAKLDAMAKANQDLKTQAQHVNRIKRLRQAKGE